MGATVTCTDLTSPEKTAGKLHTKYGVNGRISYDSIDAVQLSMKEKYDLICWKSVLGGIGHHDNAAAQQLAIHNCFQALKPGGCLVFAENLTASRFHQGLRKRFNAWTYWRYVSREEVLRFCHEFSSVDCRCYGFFGTLGRTERQRRWLGKLDRCIDRYIPQDKLYIISVVARKGK